MKKLLLILTLLLAAPVTGMVAAAASQPEIGVSQGTLTAKPVHGALELSVSHDSPSPARFMIYSITGQMVKDLEVAPGMDVTVGLPAGYYIVKTAQWSKRIVVK